VAVRQVANYVVGTSYVEVISPSMTVKKNPGPRTTVPRYPPYLLSRQIAALKKLNEVSGAPVQWHIRKAIDEYLANLKKKKSGRKHRAPL